MLDQPGNPRKRAFVVGLILLGLVIVGVFGLRTVRAIRGFRGHHPPPPHPFATEHVETDVSLVRDWMTIPFIGRMYRVPPPILFEALGIPERQNKEKSLKQLNDEYYPQAEGIVLEKVKAAILANQPSPSPTLPTTPTP